MADELWTDLLVANGKGLLGGTIKCLKFNKRINKYLICVYVDDFTNVSACREVLYRTQNITEKYGINITANFKADLQGVFTDHTRTSTRLRLTI